MSVVCSCCWNPRTNGDFFATTKGKATDTQHTTDKQTEEFLATTHQEEANIIATRWIVESMMPVSLK